MYYLVAVETLLLVLIGLLVVGLLRSHAEILRQLAERDELLNIGAASERAKRNPILSHAVAVEGVSPEGASANFLPDQREGFALLCFLSSGCATCLNFWGPSPDRSLVLQKAELIYVTKGPAEESPGKVKRLAPEGCEVIMSTEAWDTYAVEAYPHFALLRSGTLVSEGSLLDWAGVIRMMDDYEEASAFAPEG